MPATKPPPWPTYINDNGKMITDITRMITPWMASDRTAAHSPPTTL